MDERTENLPILQDFVPYRGRCPASIKITKKNKNKKKVQQGKGTADHLMPRGDWLFFFLSFFFFQMYVMMSRKAEENRDFVMVGPTEIATCIEGRSCD